MPNPSQLFLAERPDNAPGSAVHCAIEGSRPLLVEVQALVSSSTFGNARRTANGIDQGRLSLLLAVLEKRAGLHLAGEDVFVNVAGGMTIEEPAADLSVVAAVASSLRNRVDRGVDRRLRRGRAGRRSARNYTGRPARARGGPAGISAVRAAACQYRSDRPDPGRWRVRAGCGEFGVGSARRAARINPVGDSYPASSFRSVRMAWFLLARLLFVIAVVYSAVLLRPLGGSVELNAAFGMALAVVFVAFESRLRNTSVTHMLGAMLGGAIGLGIAKTVGAALFWADTKDDRVAFLHSFVLLALPYLGLVLGGRKGEWLEPARLIGLFRGTGPQRRYRILDTSVIIDGRIADICETGFLDGTLVIPQFVLKELQLVADSSDSMKRNRGRRGLDILQKMQKMAGLEVMISDLDFPEVREVDLKLIELARALSGKIVTNDFNLNKVAQLRGVAVLNINELANSLKPVVLPGEIMKVFILKEGKEFNQGVAYLDDGTMVVVDNARKMIGKTIDVVVTSVLQTTAGKMIFGRFVDPSVAAAQGSGPLEREEPQRRPRVAPAPQPQTPASVAASAGVTATAAGPASPGGNGGVDGPLRG